MKTPCICITTCRLYCIYGALLLVFRNTPVFFCFTNWITIEQDIFAQSINHLFPSKPKILIDLFKSNKKIYLHLDNHARTPLIRPIMVNDSVLCVTHYRGVLSFIEQAFNKKKLTYLKNLNYFMLRRHCLHKKSPITRYYLYLI